ncbi:hypothetical protein LCGC14_1551550 [marine sediment metagenome]|uniref:Uncharacterized protein n=2 Tax=marine sediment metagenome TaxID=412755 RepID=A0A0F9IQ51_9ZZZZ
MSEMIRSLFAEGGALRVRAILAFVIGAVYAYLAITGEIPSEDIKEVTLLVIAFYFFTRAK